MAQLLKVREVAERLACSKSMVRKMYASGALPVVRVGSTVRVPSEAVDAYLSPGLQPVESPAQLATLVKGVVDEMVARSTADLDTRLEQLRQEIRELRWETFPRRSTQDP